MGVSLGIQGTLRFMLQKMGQPPEITLCNAMGVSLTLLLETHDLGFSRASGLQVGVEL